MLIDITVADGEGCDVADSIVPADPQAQEEVATIERAAVQKVKRCSCRVFTSWGSQALSFYGESLQTSAETIASVTGVATALTSVTDHIDMLEATLNQENKKKHKI